MKAMRILAEATTEWSTSLCNSSSLDETLPSTLDSGDLTPTRDADPLPHSQQTMSSSNAVSGSQTTTTTSTLDSASKLARKLPPQRKSAPCVGAREPRPPAPPLWKTTTRVAPDFAGLLPYELPDPLDKLYVPTMAESADHAACVYVGMYTDLRERLALLQATIDFDGHHVVQRHRELRQLVEDTAEREREVTKSLRRLERLFKERKERLQQQKVLRRRTGMSH